MDSVACVNAQPVRIVPARPTDPRSAQALTAYASEVREAAGLTALEPRSAVSEVAGFSPPAGCFLLALADDRAVGCVGLQPVDAATAEIKRMWVHPAQRRTGLGSRLLNAVEDQARERGYTRLLLDTHRALTAAVRFYTKHGYRSVARYNDNPDATNFYGKDLRTQGGIR